jgi:hypothetical protein
MAEIMEAPDHYPDRFCGGMQITAKRIAGIDGSLRRNPASIRRFLNKVQPSSREVFTLSV